MSSKDPSFKKTASPDKAPPKKGARREKEAPAKETKNKAKDKFLASQAAKSTSSIKLRKDGASDREVQKILTETKAKKGQKRRLTNLERTALEGAKYVSRPTKKARA